MAALPALAAAARAAAPLAAAAPAAARLAAAALAAAVLAGCGQVAPTVAPPVEDGRGGSQASGTANAETARRERARERAPGQASARAQPAPTGERREQPREEVQSWGKPLPYPVLIADRGNNRLVEVTPDKRIVWEFRSPDLTLYRGNDDAFFAPDGESVMVSEEENQDIHLVDYATRSIVWTYGHPDKKGSAPGFLHYPDDAYLLPDGQVVVADIRNCRVLFLDRKTSRVVTQWGQPGRCRHDPPRTLASPNGATPLPGGDLLLTEIGGAWATRMTRDGRVVWSARIPHVRYPSDAYLTADGQVVVADYSRPGRLVIFDPKTRRVSWEYFVTKGEGMLDHPSLARELPTGDIILNDDYRHRVLVIDRRTKAIVWQYGVTDRPGDAPGFLNEPDGLDLDTYHAWPRP